MERAILRALHEAALPPGPKPVAPKPTGDVDSGKKGKEFEAAFIKALKFLNLDFEKNKKTGTFWDIRPKGSGWHRLIKDRDVNLKVHSTRWLFSDRATFLSAKKARKMVMKGTLTSEQADERAANSLRKALIRKGAAWTAFLKPKSAEFQSALITAVNAEDYEKVYDLLQYRNFSSKRIGRSYDISVSIQWKSEEWVKTAKIRIDGGVGTKIGITGDVRKLGGIFTFAFRDRAGTPAKPHHAARVRHR